MKGFTAKGCVCVCMCMFILLIFTCTGYNRIEHYTCHQRLLHFYETSHTAVSKEKANS